MNFRENLLKFLNEQKENATKEITEKFEKNRFFFGSEDLSHKIASSTNQIQNLIDYAKSEYFLHSEKPYRESILKKYERLNEVEERLNKIRELFPCNHDDY